MAGGIFTGELDAQCTAMMMVYMLTFCCSWEYMTNKIEARCKDNIANREMLTKVYKELMILGFIAGCVIMAKEWGYTMAPKQMHCFEFCDLLVTICVLLYVATNVIASFSMHVTRREWDRISMMSVQDVVAKLEDYLQLRQTSGLEKFKSRLPLLGDWAREEADFKIIELLFKSKFHLGRDFDYIMYVKNVLETNVVDLANISTYHWISIGMISLSIYFGAGMLDDTESTWCVWCGGEEASATPSSHRRHLAAGPETLEPCHAAIACNMTNTEVAAALSSVLANGSGGYLAEYRSECGVCEAARAETLEDENRTKLSLFIYIGFGYFLICLQGSVLFTVKRRIRRMITLHGAQDISVIPELLRKLDQTVQEDSTDPDALGDDDVVVDSDSDEDEEERDYDGAENSRMIIFHQSQMTANDIMSWRTFRILIFITKWAQLLNCFYLGFYLCHMQMRVKKVAWDTSGHQSFGTSLGNGMIHLLILVPVIVLVVWFIPVTTRSISLAIGVLHLHEDAVSKVERHMEKIWAMRKRIWKRMKKSKIIKGKPKPSKGEELIQHCLQNEVSCLQHISKRARGDHRRDRLTRGEFVAQLGRGTDVEFEQALSEFMNREKYEEYLSVPEVERQVWQASRTLERSPDTPENDTMEAWEYEKFLVRSIANVANLAEEHGTPASSVQNFVEKVMTKSENMDAEHFEQARMLARIKSLFNVVAKRRLTLDKTRLHNGLRRFRLTARLVRRVPFTWSEITIIMRVMDPDQSGEISMNEWINFMMSTNDQLYALKQANQVKMREQNAQKGHGINAYAKDVAEFTGLPLSMEGVEELIADGKSVLNDPLQFLGLPAHKSASKKEPWRNERLAKRESRLTIKPGELSDEQSTQNPLQAQGLDTPN